MYSYEERIRAVRLYIDLGKRGAATVRQLGYPTTKALERWHKQYERGHDLPAGYVRLRPKYSAEEKQAAVDHYLNHGQCLAWTLKSLVFSVNYPFLSCCLIEKCYRRITSISARNLRLTTPKITRSPGYSAGYSIRLVKRRQALVETNLPKNSQLENSSRR